MGKDSPSPPPAPDYTGAAQATSQGSVQAAIANNLLNQRNTYTPLGSQTFQQNGTFNVPSIGGQPAFDIPTYQQNINLTPQGQQLYSGELQSQLGLMGLQGGALNRASQSLNQPFDASSVPQIANQSYAMQTARLDPQWAANKQAFDAQMANQGLAPGGEAYNNAYRQFTNAQNDAYNQARLSSIQTMPQTYQLATAAREQPLTELSSLMTGAQPQMPQFQPVATAGGAQGPNYMGATQAQAGYNQGIYNQQAAQQNAMTGGLFGLGGALGSAYLMGGGMPFGMGFG